MNKPQVVPVRLLVPRRHRPVRFQQDDETLDLDPPHQGITVGLLGGDDRLRVMTRDPRLAWSDVGLRAGRRDERNGVAEASPALGIVVPNPPRLRPRA